MKVPKNISLIILLFAIFQGYETESFASENEAILRHQYDVLCRAGPSLSLFLSR